MAKKNSLQPGLLFCLAAALLCAGWLMKPFPLFIFAGLAPLFAIIDHAQDEERFWNLAELILVALAAGFLAAHVFELESLFISLVEAIAVTLAFVAYSFAYQRFDGRLGKFTVIFFWLAIEYVFLKLPWRENMIYMADALTLKPDWLKWTHYSGYLGASFWVLAANWMVYLTLLKGGKINGAFLVLTILWITAPIIFSYYFGGMVISRVDMIALYNKKISSLDANYIQQGEVIPRIAAWISLLVLFVAVVKNKTRQG